MAEQSEVPVAARVRQSLRRLDGLSYQEKLAFFCRARAGAKRFSAPPETAFAERWRPSLGAVFVRPMDMPPDGYLTRGEALQGARGFRQRCRALLRETE